MDLWDIATGLMEIAYNLDEWANKIKDMFWFAEIGDAIEAVGKCASSIGRIFRNVR